MKRITLLLSAIFLLPFLSADAQDLVIRGGWLFPDSGEEMVRNPGVLIRSGKIMQVGDLPESVEEPELLLSDDEYLLPGLIDLHAHYRVVEDGTVYDDTSATPKIFLANGVTATFPAGEVQPEKMRELRQQIDRGERAGPRLLNSGPYFGTAAPDWDRSFEAEDIIRRVDEWADKGVAGFKAKGITREHLEILIGRAHRHGLTVTAHLDSGYRGSVNPKEAVEMGIDRVEHFLGGDCLPDTASAYASLRSLSADQPCVDEIIDLFVTRQVFFDATMSTYGIIGRDSSSAFRYWTDEMRFFTPRLRDHFAEPDTSLETLFREVYHAKQGIVKKYFEAGGQITLATDRPVMRSTLPFLGGFAAHREMQALSESGIPNHEVLRIATRNSARAIGLGDRLGSVEPGRWADLFVVRGNPLEDITRTRHVQHVVKHGVPFDPQQLLQSAEGKLGADKPVE